MDMHSSFCHIPPKISSLQWMRTTYAELIDVDFDKHDVWKLAAELFEDRGYHLAGPAPRCAEVNDHLRGQVEMSREGMKAACIQGCTLPFASACQVVFFQCRDTVWQTSCWKGASASVRCKSNHVRSLGTCHDMVINVLSKMEPPCIDKERSKALAAPRAPRAPGTLVGVFVAPDQEITAPNSAETDALLIWRQ